MACVFMEPNPGARKGFDPLAQYQMIPVGGARSMALWVQPGETEDVVVYVADPNRAHLYGLYTIQGQASIQGSGYFVKRGSAIRFFVGSRDPGPTSLVVETLSGRLRSFLLLSVKPALSLNYQICVLSDPVHVPAKDLAGQNMVNNMRGAEKLWLDQANVQLNRVGGINDVIVPFDIGDPIYIDKAAIFDAIVAATFTPLLAKAHLYIYATWDLVYTFTTLVGGSNTANCCFIENQFSGRTGELVCAHEVGHALGLPHSADRVDLLMNGSGIGNDLLDMLDIEASNRL